MLANVNAYDEYGIPAATNTGRFQYTGQAWLPELGLYYYKARMYSPTLGRSMQTDPIGYGDGLNMYAYVGSDPVNATDPSGLACRLGQVTIYTVEGPPPRKPPQGYDAGVTARNHTCVTLPTMIRNGPPSNPVPQPSPPQKVDPKVIARNQCRLAAVAAGAANVAVDLAGLIPGERAAAVIIRAATTAISGTNAITGQDAAGGALTLSGFFNDLRAALPTPTSGAFVKALGQSLPGLGVIITGASVTKDLLDARKAYQRCGAE